MSDIVITVENLSKRYLIGHQSAQRERYTALRDVIAREARNFVRKTLDFVGGRQIVQGDDVEEFWALREVSFEVKRGEVVGVIGRNGAGKSTLLKVLTRITEPTTGRVKLRGRLASLLEIGTGFHAELTGRENIYLNGAILGMSRKEIGRKFDEIVAFSEVEQFLDTPVKHYSSGMYVRLAFAVAAHLEPDILIVDEVLAVGDAEFQKKCLGKLDDVSRREGRTVILVSHNMSAIGSLCSKGIYLDHGRLKGIGETKEVVSKYLSRAQVETTSGEIILHEKQAKHRNDVLFTSVSILNHERNISPKLEVTNSFHVCVRYKSSHKASGIELALRIETFDGIAVFTSTYPLLDSDRRPGVENQQETRYVKIPAMLLMPGLYFVTVAAHTPMVEVHVQHQQILEFEIIDNGTPFAKYRNYRQIGIVMVDLPWRSTLDA